MYTASIIAKWFLNYNREMMALEDADYISNLKLQKLLYYAQGTYYAITDKLLFADPIVAWMHGPVVESVYYYYRENEGRGIVFDEEFNEEFDKETEDILIEVYNYFGQYSAWKLRNMTHEESPWLETPRNQVIDVEKIKEYFLKEYVE